LSCFTLTVIYFYISIVAFFLSQKHIVFPFSTNYLVVVLIVNPTVFRDFMSISSNRYVIIASCCVFSSRKWRIGSIFPIAFAIHMYPRGRTFIARAIIYLKYFLRPLSFYFIFWKIYIVPHVIMVVHV